MCGAHHSNLQRGFTLVESIIVIVITGILFSVVAVFIARPVQGDLDSVRRAELTDQADITLRRMMRDIRLALPNSLRVTTSGGASYIEFIMTSAGGRYRDSGDGSTGGNFLSFTSTAANTFDIVGSTPANTAIAGDYVVVYNLGPGYNPGNAYNYDVATDTCNAGGCNIAKVATAPASNPLTLTKNPFASQTPPLSSPTARFQVVPGTVKAVTYACNTTTAGDLSRYANYGLNATQPITGLGTAVPLAKGNATCTVDYTTAVLGRNGLLFVSLTLTSGAETVTLFQQIHVDNSP